MKCHSKLCLSLVLAVVSSAPALGQFPWSRAKETPTIQKTGSSIGQRPESLQTVAPAAVHKTGSITWKTDLPEAMKLAQEQHKLVFLHFSGTHCPPCRKLEENVLNRNDVAITMLSRYVPVFIVVEQAQELVERFNVKGWPTDVIIDAEGREIARHISPQDSREFIKRISAIAAKHNAGQSATIANVRAAVAADVMEESPSVQQTGADDRVAPTRQSPRAESKVVRNPHTREQLAPIVVARDTKPRKSIAQGSDSEEEGFSPPQQRRLPPIVRKTHKTEEEESVAAKAPRVKVKSLEEPIEEESAVAPWRQGWKPERDKPVEVAAGPDEHSADEQSEESQQKVAEEPAHEESPEPVVREHHVASELPSKPVETQVEAEGAKEEAVAPKVEAKSEVVEEAKPASPPLDEEADSKKSRYAEAEQADEQPAEKKAKVEEPAQEAVEPKAEPVAEEKKAEAPAEPQVESKPEVKEEAEVAPEVKGNERKPKKSRYDEEEVEQPAVETEKAKPEAEVTAEPEPSKPDAESKQEESKPAEAEPQASEETAEQKTEASPKAEAAKEVVETEEAPAKEEVPAKVDAEVDAEVDPVKPEVEVAPVKKEAAPKAKAKKQPASEAEAVKEEAPADDQPRGIAKLTRTGKYVLGGHCCVALMETEKLKKGNPKIGAVHRGRIYLFASEEARAKFLQNPDDYSPMLTGYDPVIYAEKGELVEGSSEILAKLHDGRIITFANEETYNKFAVDYKKSRDRSVYVETTRAAMKETNGGRHLR